MHAQGCKIISSMTTTLVCIQVTFSKKILQCQTKKNFSILTSSATFHISSSFHCSQGSKFFLNVPEKINTFYSNKGKKEKSMNNINIFLFFLHFIVKYFKQKIYFKIQYLPMYLPSSFLKFLKFYICFISFLRNKIQLHLKPLMNMFLG